jgi:hypothetical protein
MEQEFINQLICLIRKSGGGAFVRRLWTEVDENNNTREWTEDEIINGVNHIRWVNEYFGRDEALTVIRELLNKYHITLEDISLNTVD